MILEIRSVRSARSKVEGDYLTTNLQNYYISTMLEPYDSISQCTC